MPTEGSFLALRAALGLPHSGDPVAELKRSREEYTATMDAACTWLAACVHSDSAQACSELLFWVAMAKRSREEWEHWRDHRKAHPEQYTKR